MNELTSSASRLYEHIYQRHWRPPSVVGPDPGIRWNARIGRFVKSYLPRINWHDDLVYAQAQKYWIQSNLLMSDLRLEQGSEPYQVAIECADYLSHAQTPEGFWPYPNPEWKGRIATVEGNYAAIGMLLVFDRTRSDHLLDSARRWYEYSVNEIGFQHRGNTLAINYFGNVAGGRIPNNSASTVRAFAMLAEATGDSRYLQFCGPMIEFMSEAQVATGELPYSVIGVTGGDRPHFLCHQYNAFQFLNILDYWRLTNDDRAMPILANLAEFLADGLTDNGAARYDCDHDEPEVVYYAAALGTALREATAVGFGDYSQLADRLFDRLLSHQLDNGGFPYSFHNYRLGRDTRSYPRYQSMILTHLLTEISQQDNPIAGATS